MLTSTQGPSHHVRELGFRALFTTCDIVLDSATYLFTMYKNYQPQCWRASEIPQVKRHLLRRSLTPPLEPVSLPARLVDAVVFPKQQVCDQDASPFFTKLPPEVRALIYDHIFIDAPRNRLDKDGLMVRRVWPGPSWQSMM